MVDELGLSLSTMGSGITTALSSPVVAGSTGVIGGSILGAAATSLLSRTKRRKSRTVRKRNNSHRKRHKQKQPYTAGKRKDRSTRRIRYTKNNQPYVILANGRARFISKRSASRSKKRKGGKY